MPADKDDLREAHAENARLREMLAVAYSGVKNLYGDDGELQDNATQPFIDFRRDSVEVIGAKMAERGRRRLQAEHEAGTLDPVVAKACGFDPWDGGAARRMFASFSGGIGAPAGSPPETITEAAIRVDPETVYTVARPGRHDAVIRSLEGQGYTAAQFGPANQGFVTSRDRFVDRKEAARIALAAGQCERLRSSDDELDSYDLW